MPTKTRRAVRKIAPILDKIEPFAVFFAYIAVGIMALFAWVYPPQVTAFAGTPSLIIEAVLLSAGCVLGLWGHIIKSAIIELYGVISTAGGLFILLTVVINVMIHEELYNYGQFAGLILLAFGLLSSYGFKLYHAITENWIHPPANIIKKIYKD